MPCFAMRLSETEGLRFQTLIGLSPNSRFTRGITSVASSSIERRARTESTQSCPQ